MLKYLKIQTHRWVNVFPKPEAVSNWDKLFIFAYFLQRNCEDWILVRSTLSLLYNFKHSSLSIICHANATMYKWIVWKCLTFSIFVSSSSISHSSCVFSPLVLYLFPIHCASANPFYPRNFRKHLRMVGSRRVKVQSELFVDVCVCMCEWLNEFVNDVLYGCVYVVSTFVWFHLYICAIF